MGETPESTSAKLPPGTPKWVIVLCCLVGSVIIPLFVALSPQLSELIKGAIQAKSEQAENEKTALGTVLKLVNTTTTQVQVLSQALATEQQQKRALSDRVTELEKSDQANGRALKDCEGRLKTCMK